MHAQGSSAKIQSHGVNPDDLPGDIISGSCLPHERLATPNKDIIHNDLSGDDQPVDVQSVSVEVQAHVV